MPGAAGPYTYCRPVATLLGMTDIQLPMEWPSFADIPLEEAIPTSRPKGQALSRYIWWDGEIRDRKSTRLNSSH